MNTINNSIIDRLNRIMDVILAHDSEPDCKCSFKKVIDELFSKGDTN